MKASLILIAILVFSGCNYNNSKGSNAQNLQPVQKVTSPEQITFKMVNEAVIANACAKCHSAAGGNKGGVNLESYANVFKLAHEIRQEVAGATMPPNGKLTEAQIKLITDWIDVGALEFGKIAGEVPVIPPTPPSTSQTPVVPPEPPATSGTTPVEPPANPPANPPVVPPTEKINFATVLEKVIQTNCFKCHTAATGNKGDVNLETYENVFHWRAEIADEVSHNRMPTKRGTPLTPEQKQLILTWISEGAPL